MEHDLARQERANAQQRICLLEGELRGEKDLKVAVEAVTARLATKVSQRWEKILDLVAEVTWWRDEARKL